MAKMTRLTLLLEKLKAQQWVQSGPPVGHNVTSNLKGAQAAHRAAKAQPTCADEISVKVKKICAQKGSGLSSHPKLSIVRGLIRFMNLRDVKIAKQTLVSKERKLTANDHHVMAEKARQLAERLSDPNQVSAYICELTQKADAHVQAHREMLDEVIDFWYGPAGLSWLALQKDMDPKDWSEYTDFMDAAAMKAHEVGSQWSPSFLDRATLEFELETDSIEIF